MLDNDGIMIANVSEGAEKIPTDQSQHINNTSKVDY